MCRLFFISTFISIRTNMFAYLCLTVQNDAVPSKRAQKRCPKRISFFCTSKIGAHTWIFFPCIHLKRHVNMVLFCRFYSSIKKNGTMRTRKKRIDERASICRPTERHERKLPEKRINLCVSSQTCEKRFSPCRHYSHFPPFFIPSLSHCFFIRFDVKLRCFFAEAKEKIWAKKHICRM